MDSTIRWEISSHRFMQGNVALLCNMLHACFLLHKLLNVLMSKVRLLRRRSRGSKTHCNRGDILAARSF